jgi:hypothetical protein
MFTYLLVQKIAFIPAILDIACLTADIVLVKAAGCRASEQYYLFLLFRHFVQLFIETELFNHHVQPPSDLDNH